MAVRAPGPFLCVAIGILIFIAISTVSIIFIISYHFHSVTTFPFSTPNLTPSILHPQPNKHDFVAEALNHEVSDPFNISAISDLCLTRRSRDDVIISCDPGTGGVGNIRSYMLHCTRFAMEAGASIILPNFHLRQTGNLSSLRGPIIHFEHFFDRRHYVDTIQTACPHITIHQDTGQKWSNYIPQFGVSATTDRLNRTSGWRLEFDDWFEYEVDSKDKPAILLSYDPGRDLAVMDDGMPFYYAIGRVLKFRPDARRLAALCTAEINLRFNLNLDPTSNLFPHAYMGAHLRTSNDAVQAGWDPDFEEQTDWYINQTLTHNLRIIYAAGGNDADLSRFATKAAHQNIEVVSKYDLLTGNDLRELRNFLWDQRGLVDFEVLLKASQFGGYARSSFSHNIAFRRHFLSGVEDPFADESNQFVDELSVVYGRFEEEWEDEAVRTMWP